MPSNIEILLNDRREEKINYDDIIEKYPWIVEENHHCVLSPDSDGFLCGLFMSKFRNWKVVGFYDDKLAVINRNFLNQNPIFLDGEIFRKGIRSIGHHMVMVNKRRKPTNFDIGFSNCIQPNLLRQYDRKEFRLKYPLATIHLLVSILAYAQKEKNPIIIPEKAIPPLFFTDGVFQVLFSYPENVLNWLHYLRIDETWNPLKQIFENDRYTVFTLMKEMNSFFRKRDQISISRERGDRLRISNKEGNPENINNIETGICSINFEAKDRINKFIDLVASLTNWDFVCDDWLCWENLQYFKFTKGSFKEDGKTITNANFSDFLNRNPLSWAMTSNDNIEYTIETPAKFPFDIYKGKI